VLPQWLEIRQPKNDWSGVLLSEETLFPYKTSQIRGSAHLYSISPSPARCQQFVAHHKPGVAVTGPRLLMHVSVPTLYLTRGVSLMSYMQAFFCIAYRQKILFFFSNDMKHSRSND
jgi:hypothetical protein